MSDIILNKNIDTALPQVYGNSTQLEQVFINLLLNAFDTFGNNSKPRKIDLTITHLQDNDNIAIKLSDNGEGIEKSIINNIFDPFFTTKEPGKGTGLGLSIVYGIIDNHNDAITCESEKNKGTTFKIQLLTRRLKRSNVLLIMPHKQFCDVQNI